MGKNTYLYNMEKTPQGKTAIRYNVSDGAVKNIEVTQAKLRLSKGKKITKEDTANFMLMNFKLK